MNKTQLKKEFAEYRRREDIADKAQESANAQRKVVEAMIVGLMGIEQGTVVKTPDGELHKVVSWKVHIWRNDKDPMNANVRLRALRKKKGGSWGALPRRIYGKWEKVEEAK